jgi:hypothetical protein
MKQDERPFGLDPHPPGGWGDPVRYPPQRKVSLHSRFNFILDIGNIGLDSADQ